MSATPAVESRRRTYARWRRARDAQRRGPGGEFADGWFEALALSGGVALALLLWRGEAALVAIGLLPLWLLVPLALWRVHRSLWRRARGVLAVAGFLALVGVPVACAGLLPDLAP